MRPSTAASLRQFRLPSADVEDRRMDSAPPRAAGGTRYGRGKGVSPPAATDGAFCRLRPTITTRLRRCPEGKRFIGRAPDNGTPWDRFSARQRSASALRRPAGSPASLRPRRSGRQAVVEIRQGADRAVAAEADRGDARRAPVSVNWASGSVRTNWSAWAEEIRVSSPASTTLGPSAAARAWSSSAVVGSEKMTSRAITLAPAARRAFTSWACRLRGQGHCRLMSAKDGSSIATITGPSSGNGACHSVDRWSARYRSGQQAAGEKSPPEHRRAGTAAPAGLPA
jgi:hypothetical protein